MTIVLCVCVSPLALTVAVPVVYQVLLASSNNNNNVMIIYL